MKKKIIAIICILSIIIIFNVFLVSKCWNKEDKQGYEEQKQISELKQQFGVIGENDIYRVSEEYDGRKVLEVKPTIKYSVALAGILENAQPKYSEINKVLKKSPSGTGIWINKDSREEFLKLLELITNSKYSINEKGFLVQDESEHMNKYDEKLKAIILSKKLYIIDINSRFYTVDEVTGEVIEYPFEEMDPYTPFEYLESDNKTIFIITTNSQKKLNENSIISEIIENIVL